MIEPEEIRERARRLWDSGRVLTAVLSDDGLFPWAVPFRKPAAADWLNRFAELRAWSERLQARATSESARSYRLKLREAQHRQLGRQWLPERIVFETADDLAGYIGRSEDLQRFRALAATIAARQPALSGWLAANPLQALELAADWPALLAAIEWFQAHPRPGRYLRELDIEGVDTKFAERRREVLSRLLDLCLTESAVDRTVMGLAQNGFERRYGLKYEEPRLRLRLLDAACSPGWGIRDLSVPLSEFRNLAPPIERLFVTENKTNFLSFPDHPRAAVLFGQGYGVQALREAEWLRSCELIYWGDIDTHGFAILSMLRQALPQLRSLLMDRDTLLACRRLWVDEPADKRLDAGLTGLTADEASLYDDLRHDRLGLRVRLEQERVPFALLARALGVFNSTP